MTARRYKPRLKPTEQPRLSEVELIAVQLYLRWQCEMALAQRDTWAEACKIHRNPQTIACHRYHSDAFAALSKALSQAEEQMADRRAGNSFPNPTLDPIDVIARN